MARTGPILITGSAGFVGYHLAEALLARGETVVGLDAMTDYYDVRLKEKRHEMLSRHPGFSAHKGLVEDEAFVEALFSRTRPAAVVHLAAQAGVRYSIDNPRAYLEANVVGTFNVTEAARAAGCQHLMIASSSSVYGANDKMPYKETDKADLPMSFYAATKKATEAMSHATAHIHDLPVTMFRFFTVYGPWGRPDMALFKFTDAILNGRPIDVYNHGKMQRDFTYVTDLIEGICLLLDRPPKRGETPVEGDTLSPVAPWRVVNIGNGAPQALGDFIAAIEAATGRTAVQNLMEMQPGDVPATWADNALLRNLTGYAPRTDLRTGVAAFVDWYRDYYDRPASKVT